jgi:ssDNA-binding Zn-finger/Zn-ribbon topoisomerase 1
MPKLSNKTLEKMFICPNCGRPLRTRQGLSGHIQFKHQALKPTSSSISIDEVTDIQELHLAMEVAGMPQFWAESVPLILSRWPSIRIMCDILKLTTNNQDYKNYIISSLARMYENDNFKTELLDELSKLLK